MPIFIFILNMVTGHWTKADGSSSPYHGWDDGIDGCPSLRRRMAADRPDTITSGRGGHHPLVWRE